MATYEEKKAYLESYAVINRDIAILELRLQKEPLTAQQYSSMPAGGSVGDPVGNMVVSVMDAKRRLPGLRKRKEQILEAVDEVENPLFRQLLTCRFIDGMSYRETSELLHVSKSVVERCQKPAIESIKLKKRDKRDKWDKWDT